MHDHNLPRVFPSFNRYDNDAPIHCGRALLTQSTVLISLPGHLIRHRNVSDIIRYEILMTYYCIISVRCVIIAIEKNCRNLRELCGVAGFTLRGVFGVFFQLIVLIREHQLMF